MAQWESRGLTALDLLEHGRWRHIEAWPRHGWPAKGVSKAEAGAPLQGVRCLLWLPNHRRVLPSSSQHTVTLQRLQLTQHPSHSQHAGSAGCMCSCRCLYALRFGGLPGNRGEA